MNLDGEKIAASSSPASNKPLIVREFIESQGSQRRRSYETHAQCTYIHVHATIQVYRLTWAQCVLVEFRDPRLCEKTFAPVWALCVKNDKSMKQVNQC